MAEPNMIERVAEALANADNRRMDALFYRSAARVAVEVMRRPTTKMRERGDEARAADETAGMIYMVMTDEAMREPT